MRKTLAIVAAAVLAAIAVDRLALWSWCATLTALVDDLNDTSKMEVGDGVVRTPLLEIWTDRKRSRAAYVWVKRLEPAPSEAEMGDGRTLLYYPPALAWSQHWRSAAFWIDGEIRHQELRCRSYRIRIDVAMVGESPRPHASLDIGCPGF